MGRLLRTVSKAFAFLKSTSIKAIAALMFGLHFKTFYLPLRTKRWDFVVAECSSLKSFWLFFTTFLMTMSVSHDDDVSVFLTIYFINMHSGAVSCFPNGMKCTDS